MAIIKTRNPPNFTWATLPSAANYVGYARVSDVGIVGTLFYSNGTYWGCDPITIVKKGIGWIVPSLITGDAATYSQTGTTITVTSTAHTITAAVDGCNVYLVSGTGSLVTGWFTNFIYVDANSFTCTSTISQSISGTLLTNLSNITVDDVTTSVKGNLMGRNGCIEILASSIHNNNASQKKLGIMLGSTLMNTLFTTSVSASIWRRFDNCNSTSNQKGWIVGTTNAGASPTGMGLFTIDTSADQDFKIYLGNAAASCYSALVNVEARIIVNNIPG